MTNCDIKLELTNQMIKKIKFMGPKNDNWLMHMTHLKLLCTIT